MTEKNDIERDTSVSQNEDVKLGEISNETLSPEEDKRILRKIDRWYVLSLGYPHRQVLNCHCGMPFNDAIEPRLTDVGSSPSWHFPISSNFWTSLR